MNKVKELRLRNKETQLELANAIEAAISTVASWEQGVQDPNKTMRKRIAEHYKVSEGDVMGWAIPSILREQQTTYSNIDISETPIKEIPLISWVQASNWNMAEDPLPPGNAEKYIFLGIKGGNNMFGLKIVGNCMEPKFQEGDIIIIDPEQDVHHGQYGVFKVSGENKVTFKQLKMVGEKAVLHPLNSNHEDIILDGDKEYLTIGRVVGSYKEV